MLRKQSKNQYRLESWKSQSSNIRAALDIVHDLSEALRSVQDELLDRNDVDKLGLDDCLNRLHRELGPKLSKDAQLNELLQWTRIHMTSFKMNKVPDFDNFSYRVHDVMHALRSPEAGREAELELEEVYKWIKKFTHYAVLQRKSYDDLVENLRRVQGALNTRLP
ncbi:hypothetical protein AB0H12_15315 [Actinosynnema sp. NPDC023794]